MYILGISCGGESGAALFKNDQLLCASNEERFSRIKLDIDFPKYSLQWCLNDAGITSNEVEKIIYGFSSGCETEDQKGALLEKLINLDSSSETGKIIKSRVVTETQVDREKYEEFLHNIQLFFQRNIPIERIHHHMSHVASAYIPSGMEKALVVTADGRGDYRSLTIGIATAESFKELYIAPSWNSLGYFYGRMTKLCGFTPNRHEGKVTGLAAYGDATKALTLVKKMIRIENGEVVSKLGDYYRPFFSNYSEELIKEAEKFSREDLAAATQLHFEHMIVELIHFYLEKTGVETIALAGGIFSNISLNQAIYEIDDKVDVFVYPNMGDAGICVGGCYAWLWKNKKIVPKKIESVYLGYEITPLTVANTLVENGYKVEQPDDLISIMLELLETSSTIGLVQGRAEFGPRALGNRTILASPQERQIIEKINAQLGRDTFMPLAPVMPLELAEEYIEFKNNQSFEKGYFMTMTYNAKPALKKVAEAVVHVDGTVRPQFITKQSNPFLHALLMQWYTKTGCPVLINTSFNAHEEPIVNSESDAVKAFKNNVVDVLVSPPYISR